MSERARSPRVPLWNRSVDLAGHYRTPISKGVSDSGPCRGLTRTSVVGGARGTGGGESRKYGWVDGVGTGRGKVSPVYNGRRGQGPSTSSSVGSRSSKSNHRPFRGPSGTELGNEGKGGSESVVSAALQRVRGGTDEGRRGRHETPGE